MAPLVFITGASSGIGQALALRFHAGGLSRWRWWPVAPMRSRRGPRRRAYRKTACASMRADVAIIDSIVAAGHACLQEQGVPDVVIAAAGISVGIDTRRAGGPRRDGAGVCRQQRRHGGDVSSVCRCRCGAADRERWWALPASTAYAGLPGHGAYCASKAAVISYCESLRGELRASGVQVVTICPGYIDTPLTRGNRYRMPFLMSAEAFAAQGLRHHRARAQLPRDPVADGPGRQVAAPVAQRLVRPPVCGSAAQAARGRYVTLVMLRRRE